MTRPTAMAPDASTSPVDWSLPIEAMHEDGSVIKAHHTDAMVAGDHSRWVKAAFDDGSTGHWFNQNGNANHTRWRIRNVQPTTPELDPALWDRMVALVRRMACLEFLNGHDLWKEAQAIVGQLNSADVDVVAAREIYTEANVLGGDEADFVAAGGMDAEAEMQTILAAIKRGRELAGEQA